ncbi:hypothetical protein F5883DRAFT_649951 [Diaporthe sp. PMI_573]|nr:hypothetical protein F5883DRAFT_649951 [Diaporthaceae sp. PMI_573]
MQFSFAVLVTALAAAVSAAAAAAVSDNTNPLEARECLPNGAVCSNKVDCCSGGCFWGDYPPSAEHPAHCG